MTATYVPSSLATSPKDQIRFLVGDTDSSSWQLQDEEIMWAYAIRGTTWGAGSMCALALSAKYSRLTSISADGVSESMGEKAKAFALLAQELLKKEALMGGRAFLYGMSIADIVATAADTDRVPDLFRHGMDDNPPSDAAGIMRRGDAEAVDDGIL